MIKTFLLAQIQPFDSCMFVVARKFLRFVLDINVPILLYRPVVAVDIVCVGLMCSEWALLCFLLII